jgi:hypothetical protein
MAASKKGIRWRRSAWFNVLHYGFCPDEETWERERAKALVEGHVEIGPYPAHAGMSVAYLDGKSERRMLVTLGIELDSDPIQLVSTLAHECWHVASAHFEAMKEDEPGEETQAYVLGAIMAEMFEDYSLTRSPWAKGAAS